MILLHVTTAADWNAAHAAGGLAGTPFLHLCTPDQLDFVMRQHFAGRHGLVVLRADTRGLDVRWEVSEPGMDPFPHLYERLPVDAIVDMEAI